MTWRLARSLETLRAEIDRAAPKRSKASDGTLGDPAHASRCSRHNPNAAGVVTAFDCTHDPANGCDIHARVRAYLVQPLTRIHPELEYVISNRQVFKRQNNFKPEAYTGENPHDKHAHFGVGRGTDCAPTVPYDSLQPWNFMTSPEEDDDVLTFAWFKDDRPADAAAGFKPIAGTHLYAIDGAFLIHQTGASWKKRQELGAYLGAKPLLWNTSSTPWGYAWISGYSVVDGPLKGIQ